MAQGAKRPAVLAAPSKEKDIEILHEFRRNKQIRK